VYADNGRVYVYNYNSEPTNFEVDNYNAGRERERNAGRPHSKGGVFLQGGVSSSSSYTANVDAVDATATAAGEATPAAAPVDVPAALLASLLASSKANAAKAAKAAVVAVGATGLIFPRGAAAVVAVGEIRAPTAVGELTPSAKGSSSSNSSSSSSGQRQSELLSRLDMLESALAKKAAAGGGGGGGGGELLSRLDMLENALAKKAAAGGGGGGGGGGAAGAPGAAGAAGGAGAACAAGAAGAGVTINEETEGATAEETEAAGAIQQLLESGQGYGTNVLGLLVAASAVEEQSALEQEGSADTAGKKRKRPQNARSRKDGGSGTSEGSRRDEEEEWEPSMGLRKVSRRGNNGERSRETRERNKGEEQVLVGNAVVPSETQRQISAARHMHQSIPACGAADSPAWLAVAPGAAEKQAKTWSSSEEYAIAEKQGMSWAAVHAKKAVTGAPPEVAQSHALKSKQLSHA
jgi:hypothetical protein